MMNTWLDVGGAAEVASGCCSLVEVDETIVAVFNLAGEFYAIQDACPHDGGELARGKVEGDEIICPRHGARFSIKTGAVLASPAYEDLRTFPVRVVQGRLLIETTP
jgi:3-phenylpropionate/trans-cinnamate dioxygenase ferredoxin subunit